MNIFGIARHDFWMQLRRKAVWITFGLITLVTVTLMTTTPWNLPGATPLPEALAQWSVSLNMFYPLAFGALLADRLPRAQRLNVEELTTATPASPGTRLVATSLGATAATLVPIVVVWAGGVVAAALRFDDLGAVWLGVAALVTVNLPGLLFVAAFSLVCPLWLPVGLYQFLFIGYYLWGNWIGPAWGIPTLSGTWLTPAGGYAASGLFGSNLIHGGQTGTWQAVASITLLVAIAGCVVGAAAWWRSRPTTSWPTSPTLTTVN